MAAARDGEDRHRLRRAVDAGAPLLAEEEEDGADQRAGVADTDPEDEARDVPRPPDRGVQTPHADTRTRPGESSEPSRMRRMLMRKAQQDEPRLRGRLLSHDARDLVGERAEVVLPLHEGRLVQEGGASESRGWSTWRRCCGAHASASSGFLLRILARYDDPRPGVELFRAAGSRAGSADVAATWLAGVVEVAEDDGLRRASAAGRRSRSRRP